VVYDISAREEDEETYRIMIKFHDGKDPMALPVLLFHAAVILTHPVIQKKKELKSKRKKCPLPSSLKE
jgi:hypothetical protein